MAGAEQGAQACGEPVFQGRPPSPWKPACGGLGITQEGNFNCSPQACSAVRPQLPAPPQPGACGMRSSSIVFLSQMQGLGRWPQVSLLASQGSEVRGPRTCMWEGRCDLLKLDPGPRPPLSLHCRRVLGGSGSTGSRRASQMSQPGPPSPQAAGSRVAGPATGLPSSGGRGNRLLPQEEVDIWPSLTSLSWGLG